MIYMYDTPSKQSLRLLFNEVLTWPYTRMLCTERRVRKGSELAQVGFDPAALFDACEINREIYLEKFAIKRSKNRYSTNIFWLIRYSVLVNCDIYRPLSIFTATIDFMSSLRIPTASALYTSAKDPQPSLVRIVRRFRGNSMLCPWRADDIRRLGIAGEG